MKNGYVANFQISDSRVALLDFQLFQDGLDRCSTIIWCMATIPDSGTFKHLVQDIACIKSYFIRGFEPSLNVLLE